MDPILEEKFIKFIDIIISSSITDTHIGSGCYPYIRAANREVTPIQQFGIISYGEVIALIMFMNPLINQEKIENIKTGISFIYEHA